MVATSSALTARTTGGGAIDLDAFARAGGTVQVTAGGGRSGDASADTTRASDFSIAQWDINRSLPGFGLTDARQTTPRQARLANVGLFSELLRIRSQNIAQAVVGTRGEGFAVQRAAAQNEWADVEQAHPWVQLLRRPNPARSPLQVWAWASLCRDLTGRAAFVVEDDARGVPRALWELFPEFGDLYPVPSPEGGIAGWVFLRADGERVELDARDVVTWEHPDPTTPYATTSLLARAAFNLDKGLYADVYERDQLKEARRPPVYLSSDQEITVARADEYGRTFRQKYLADGGRQVKGVPVFGKGLTMHPFAMNAVDLALVESLQANDTRLFRLAGVPKALYDSDANRANVFGARRVFATFTLQPEADGLAGALTLGFERAFRLGAVGTTGTLEVRSPDLTPVDQLEQARIDEIHLRSAAVTPNEVRGRAGRDDVEHGDVPLVSGALRPLGSVAVPPAPREPAASPADGDDDADPDRSGSGDTEEPEPDGEPETEEPAERSALLAVVGQARAAHVRMNEDAAAAEWAEVVRLRDAATGAMQAAAADILRQIGEAAADGIEGSVPMLRAALANRTTTGSGGSGEALADLVFRLDEWLAEWDSALAPFVMEVIAEGFRTGALRLGMELAWDATRPGVADTLAASLEKAASVPATLRAEIGAQLLDGLTAGETAAELADRVRDHVAGLADWKAQQVARTTGGGAFEAGELGAFREGGVTHKRWLSVRDGEVREAHAGVDDGEDVPLDEAFGNGLMHPLDPAGSAAEVVNCRCTLLPSTPAATPELGRSTWAQRRDAHIRERYRAEMATRYGERAVVIEELRRGTFEGQAYELATATCRKACDGG